MANLGLKCTPDALVWVSFDDTNLFKGKFQMREAQPIAERLEGAIASFDVLLDLPQEPWVRWGSHDHMVCKGSQITVEQPKSGGPA